MIRLLTNGLNKKKREIQRIALEGRASPYIVLEYLQVLEVVVAGTALFMITFSFAYVPEETDH